jgi:hypothetical protein
VPISKTFFPTDNEVVSLMLSHIRHRFCGASLWRSLPRQLFRRVRPPRRREAFSGAKGHSGFSSIGSFRSRKVENV